MFVKCQIIAKTFLFLKKLNEKKPVAKSKKKLYDFDKFEITTNYLA